MEAIVYSVLALLFGACTVLCYRLGMRDGAGEKRPAEVLQQPRKKSKPKPMTKDEKEALEQQRWVEEFRG